MNGLTDNWSTCLHTELMNNMKRYAQKISIELDEQSLSYAETGYCVQRLALVLLNTDVLQSMHRQNFNSLSMLFKFFFSMSLKSKIFSNFVIS